MDGPRFVFCVFSFFLIIVNLDCFLGQHMHTGIYIHVHIHMACLLNHDVCRPDRPASALHRHLIWCSTRKVVRAKDFGCRYLRFHSYKTDPSSEFWKALVFQKPMLSRTGSDIRSIRSIDSTLFEMIMMIDQSPCIDLTINDQSCIFKR